MKLGYRLGIDKSGERAWRPYVPVGTKRIGKVR